MKVKKFIIDMLYTCGSMAVMNLVLHIFVFPWLNKTSGPEFTGNILACLSIVYIVAITFGVGMSNTRLVEDRKGHGSNGDYLVTGVIGGVLFLAIALVARQYGYDPGTGDAWFVLLGYLTIMRSYGEADFRLNLDFASFFVYYCLVALGYALGIPLFKCTGNWTLIFIPGEIFALLLLAYRRRIIVPNAISKEFGHILRACFLLFASTAMVQMINNGDCLILKYFLGDRQVTVYSSLSLAAKTVNMIVIPLGTLLLSYLTARTIPVNRKYLLKVTVGWGALSILALAGTLIAAPLYVRFFYSDLFQEICSLNFLVNFGLALSAFGYLIRVYLIVTSTAKTVFLFESTFTILQLALAICLTKSHGMAGYAWAVIISRGLRCIVGAMLSWHLVGKFEGKAELGAGRAE